VVVDAGADFFALLLGQCVPGGGFDVVAAVFFQCGLGLARSRPAPISQASPGCAGSWCNQLLCTASKVV